MLLSQQQHLRTPFSLNPALSTVFTKVFTSIDFNKNVRTKSRFLFSFLFFLIAFLGWCVRDQNKISIRTRTSTKWPSMVTNKQQKESHSKMGTGLAYVFICRNSIFLGPFQRLSVNTAFESCTKLAVFE